MKFVPKGRTHEIRLNTKLLPLLVGILLMLQFISPYRGWLILLVGLGGAWLLSYLWARSLAEGLQLKRETRFSWARVGDRLQERFTLSNDGWAPALWAEVLDHSTLPDGPANVVASVGGRDKRFWRATRYCSRRGLFNLGPTSLLAGDPFGIYSVLVHHPGSNTLMITPPIVPLPHVSILSGGRAGDDRPQRYALARTVSDTGVREYLPGDNTKRIHWPTSARHGSLYVRKLEGATSGDWWIFLDLDDRVQAGADQKTTLELGIILAASLADRGLRQRRRVGLLMYGPDLTWLPPSGEDVQRWRILRALALADRGTRSLGELLSLERADLDQLASLILITPSADVDWVRALVPLLKRGATATVLLLDSLSFGGSANPAAVVSKLADLGISPSTFSRKLLDLQEVEAERRKKPWQISPRTEWRPLVERYKEAKWSPLS